MFRRKLTLTAGTCATLEEVRLALDVLYGERIRFKELEFDSDFCSGHGSFFAGDLVWSLIFIKNDRCSDILFDLKIGGEWYVARFDSPFDVPLEVRVIERESGSERQWKIGTSATDRRMEPFFDPRE